MQKAETGIMVQPDNKQMTKLAEVSMDLENKIYVNWPVDKKEAVIVALAEAIKLVETYKQAIVPPPQPSIMDFIRGVKK